MRNGIETGRGGTIPRIVTSDASPDAGGERFRGIVVAEPPQMGDAGLEAFEATLRYHCERLNPDPDVNIDANTSRCKWLGERMDYSTAIEAMQFREEAAKTAAAAPS